MNQNPPTDEQLNQIAARAAGLYEYATGLDAAWQDEADQLSGTDVPVLLAGVRRLRTGLANLRQQLVAATDTTEALRATQAETTARLATSRQDLADSHDDLTDALGADPHTEWADLIRAVSQQRSEIAELRSRMEEIRHLHKDSPMGPCPVCIDADAVAEGGDGLVPYPCPTGRLAGAQDCDPPHVRAAAPASAVAVSGGEQ